MILVVGSPDSGKSVKAEELAAELSGNEKKIYLATMIPFGEEGAARVEKHRALRNGKGFVTVERRLNVGKLPDSEGFIEGIRAEEATVLLECVSNLCANVMFAEGKGKDAKSPEETAEIVTEDILRLKKRVKNLIVVTNEFPPEEKFDRETFEYISAVSGVNLRLKEEADRIYDITGGNWKTYERDSEASKPVQIIRSILGAFSLYSRIPMPRFEWSMEGMRYILCFLPLIGVVIGLAEYGCFHLCDVLRLPLIAKVCVLSLVPLIITGGFHVDGYMDVKDALGSYKTKEEKLRIMKDPHIGAFAVIGFGIYALVWAGALSVLCDKGSDGIYFGLPFIFVLSRIGAAVSSLSLKKAKDDGMLKNETEMSGRGELAVMILELILCIAFLCFADPVTAMGLTVVLGLFLIYYRLMVYREFGGVTGDTAGYFVCGSELAMLFMLAVLSIIKP